jgi:hypothetical protein
VALLSLLILSAHCTAAQKRRLLLLPMPMMLPMLLLLLPPCATPSCLTIGWLIAA